MSEEFHQLLEATIDHLQSLQARGTQFVPLPAGTWGALQAAGPAARSAAAAPVASPARNVPTPRAAAPTPAILASAPVALVTPPVVTSARPDRNPAKAQALAELRERALQCLKCAHLVASRTQVVFGAGHMDADLMFVGEAPGADEDAQGEPFVGAAGQLLTRMITAMGLTRDTVYIANILKCRPDMPAGSSGNRKPTPEEMQTCIPYLQEQIDLIQPKVLVALGGTAVEGLLGKSGISKLRGQWQTYRGLPLMPTYHPSYLLRNQSNTEKRKVWEDLLAVMEKIDLPISPKQRGYFLKA